MNLRLGTDSMLFKISAAELESLLRGETLQQTLRLAGGAIRVVIEPGGDPERLEPVIERGDVMDIRLPVSPTLLEVLHSLGRHRDGLRHQSGDITVGLQVDVRSQKAAGE